MNHKITKPIFLAILFFGIFGWAESSQAATINVASPYGSTQVQVAINAATSGDTVSLPVSNVTWSSSITMKSGVTLQGAGKTNSLVNIGTNSIWVYGLMNWRVTGIGFTMTGSGGSGNGVISSGGGDYSTGGYRIDNISITSDGWSHGILLYGQSDIVGREGYGLIDHNIFTNIWIVYYGGYDGTTQIKGWSNPLTLGTASAMYIEDNTFTANLGTNQTLHFDANMGARIVARYNTMTNANVAVHSDQGSNRATRSLEFYNNNISSPSYATWIIGEFRGGTGLIFNNTIGNGFGGEHFYLNNVRSCESRPPAGQCNGNSATDGNKPDQSGYPCRDQIGRSTDASLYTAGWSSAGPNQALAPYYIWNNKNGSTEINAVLGGSSNCTNQTTYHILENRDFYNYNVSFNGTTGIGRGTLASRPATCTTNANEAGGGVGYWATDTNTLYRCSATNTWTAYYTPYTYPHPLAVGTTPPPPDTTPPAAPSGLVVN